MVISNKIINKLKLDTSISYPFGQYLICIDNKNSKRHLTVGRTYVLADQTEAGDELLSVRGDNANIIWTDSSRFTTQEQLEISASI